MTRRTLVIVVSLVTLAGAAALVVAGVLAGSDARLAPPSGDPVLLETSIAPEQALFADRLDASLAVTIDATRVDPATVEVAAFFRPFRRVGPIEVERTDLGETVVLDYSYPIQCIDRGCVAAGPLELPVGVVRYAPRDGPIGSLPLTWPAVALESRLSAGQLGALRATPEEIVLDGEADSPPPVSYSISPSALGWLLVGAGALAVLALGGWLAWRLRGPARQAVEREAPPEELPPLDAAVVAVEQTLGTAGADARRAALDALACELRLHERDRLAREARRLAWSRTVPDEEATRAFLDELRDAGQDAA